MGWRSIRTRLTLLFFAITLAAVGFVYVYLTPQLESSLRSEKLRSLESAANTYSGRLNNPIDLSERQLNSSVRAAAERTATRVTLLSVRDEEPPDTYVISDSNQETDISDLRFQVADAAVRERKVVTGTERSDDGELGQAAKPLFSDKRIRRVVVFSAPLADVADNVALVRRQILVAGGLGLLLALAASTVVARAISRRVQVLEDGAGRVARGDFSARFPDYDDELGQLSQALDHMQRQLAQLDSARKRFIATASHELRTPLFSLGGFLELLEDEELDEETRKAFIRQVRQQTLRLQKLATDLLDLSRLEAGSLELRPEPTDVASLTRAVVAEFAPAIAAHESRLELRLARSPLEADCDPERVAQVLRILLNNALTHTPSGTGLTVSAARQNGTLRLAVRDDGPGISQDALQRVFEPFYTSDDAQGSGLGLAIARELADRMTGSLDVHTTAAGTTFALRIPT
ncbi:MAG: two-component system, OmpR family, sensor kinase [Solirubrobacteraceae bacterium]|jgi:signal transduction histidine kinase|nr:two-component system, OmpR family, sensor kinase [Solirubrobacteraceae bacterium]